MMNTKQEQQMSKITSFDKQNLPQLRAEINAALAAVGAKFGVSLQAGNASFLESNATFKLVCQIGEDKSISDLKDEKAAKALKLYQPLYFRDLPLDKHYSMGKDVFEIVGYNTRGRTSPMLIKSVKSGKEYKCSVDQLRGAHKVDIVIHN
jgi:hypothetical protein